MLAKNDKEVGARLLYCREQSGLNQSQMAESIGVCPGAYQNYERGDRSVTKKVICSLMDKFNVNPNWLLSGREGSSGRLYGAIDLSLLEAIERTFKEETRKNDTTAHVYTSDLGLIYNRVNQCLKDNENCSGVVVREVRYLISIRMSEAVRDKTGGTEPLFAHNDE